MTLYLSDFYLNCLLANKTLVYQEVLNIRDKKTLNKRIMQGFPGRY